MLRKCKVCRYVYLPSARYNHCPICGSAIIGKLNININSGRRIINAKGIRKDYTK